MSETQTCFDTLIDTPGRNHALFETLASGKHEADTYFYDQEEERVTSLGKRGDRFA